MRVGLVYNLKSHVPVRLNAPVDALAEYDSEETVSAIEAALMASGHEVVRLEADTTLPETLRATKPYICFNIAEGLRGEARESHVPALLEMMGIPYTGSKVMTHALSLDKAMTKRVWRDAGLPTGSFQLFRHADDILDSRLSFPLFVKPVQEGSGMGINARSVVRDEATLRQQVRWVVQNYRQPAIVESYLPGREFTVGMIGNTLLPGERRWEGPRINSGQPFYDSSGFHVLPVLEIDSNVGAGKGVYNTAAKSYIPGEEGAPLYLCPAGILAELETELKSLAVAAFRAINGLDVGRVDFRIGVDGRPVLLEVNTLPGLNPVVSDLCIQASADGLVYNDLVAEILRLAMGRYARERASVIMAVSRDATSDADGL